jgi:hypothetical protein
VSSCSKEDAVTTAAVAATATPFQLPASTAPYFTEMTSLPDHGATFTIYSARKTIAAFAAYFSSLNAERRGLKTPAPIR